MNSSEEEIIKNFIKAYNSFDINSMLILIHPKVMFKNISNGEVTVRTIGEKEFEKLARQSLTLFKDWEQKIVSLKKTGNKIYVEIQYHAVLAVDFPNGLKAGDSIDMNGKSEYIFKDELIYSIIDES